MKIGIRQKVVLVMLGVLGLSTVMNAIVASYVTNRQNEQAAFMGLRNDLQKWRTDLQALAMQLQSVAVSTVGDVAILDQLGELMALQFALDDPSRASERIETRRTIGYRKAVSINRLQLALRTGGFSSIEVYSMGRLSHAVLPSGAGMSIPDVDANAKPTWIVGQADAKGELAVRNWPTWETAAPPTPLSSPEVNPSSQEPLHTHIHYAPGADAAIEIVIPIQGLVEEVLSDASKTSAARFVSELQVVGAHGQASFAHPASGVPGRQPTVVAVVVFRKVMDRSMLQSVASLTRKTPILMSPEGAYVQRLDDTFPTLARAPGSPCEQGDSSQCVAAAGGRSFYVAFEPMQLEGRTQLLLGLSEARDGTVANIRQTVLAILLIAVAIMLVSGALGLWWVKRFIDPIVHLTTAVKNVTRNRRTRPDAHAGAATPAPTREGLERVSVEASGEVGDLAHAFNEMIDELQLSLETLEQQVLARTGELRQQERYLRTLIDMLPMRAWFKDTESRFLAANQAEAHQVGLSPSELVGKSAQGLWPSDVAAASRAEDIEVMRTRQRMTVETVVPGPDGPMWVEVFKAPVIDEDGSLLGTVGVARDVSERKAAEAAREVALAEARRLAQTRSEFLAQMSHELRTPLNGILGFAQLLERDPSLLPDQRRGIQIIEESGRHLLTLIDDILDMARIDSAKLVLVPADVRLAAFVQAACDVVRIKAEEKGLRFVCEAEADLPKFVSVDEKRLRQVLLNLLSNAVKFTDRGQVTLRVAAVPIDRPGPTPRTRLRFEVRDTGIGLDAQQVSRLFQPFEQVSDAPRRAGGTGLGLAISRRLVRMMGGDVTVQSRPAEGSVFAFEIEVPVSTTAPEVLPAVRRPSGYLGPRRSVLVVDDVEQNRAVLVESLKGAGFEVMEAADGLQCLAMARTRRPDIVLMDVLMPGIDGPETLRRLRQIPGFGAVPMVAVSASVTPEVEAECRAAGARDFLAKPIDLDRLLGSIGELLGLELAEVAR